MDCPNGLASNIDAVIVVVPSTMNFISLAGAQYTSLRIQQIAMASTYVFFWKLNLQPLRINGSRRETSICLVTYTYKSTSIVLFKRKETLSIAWIRPQGARGKGKAITGIRSEERRVGKEC